ncbi:MAG: hypothetical protein ABEJ70_06780 [Halobacteriaceae archaeon]
MSGSDAERATRVVADADVLAADLLVGGTAREAIDAVRAHSWLTLVASESLLDDAAAVVRRLADPSLAADWRAAAAALTERVDHPAGDHPALACAYRGEAAHVLTFDDGLTGARANAALQGRMQVSVTTPDAFVHLFDPAAVHEATGRGAYEGPDRDPRA